jgi:SAM-dependent methyltransferase
MGLISRLLAHPLTQSLSVDDPATTLLRREIIEKKRFLHAIYEEWYSLIIEALPPGDRVIEIGSGAGFLKSRLPQAITSELFSGPRVDLVADACNLPFRDKAIDAIVMTNVFHHISDIALFLQESARCLRPGGRMIMIEPWRTPWSEWVYHRLHDEPFLPDAKEWALPSGKGPLSIANGALPWIVFERDRYVFEKEYCHLRINRIEPLMPVAYLLSGGVSLRSILPGFMYCAVRSLERLVGERAFAMFAIIELERRPV